MQVQAAEAGAFLLFSHARHFWSIIRFHSPLPPWAMRVGADSAASCTKWAHREPGFWAVEDRATKKRAEKKPKCFKMPPRERSLGGRQHFASKQVWSQAKMGRALPT